MSHCFIFLFIRRTLLSSSTNDLFEDDAIVDTLSIYTIQIFEYSSYLHIPISFILTRKLIHMFRSMQANSTRIRQIFIHKMSWTCDLTLPERSITRIVPVKKLSKH